ncbi:Translation initiation factor IF-2 [Maioricimonas rarisocia]|uniref:Translation initiation factor IF-2 n=1 Tax=Maioricimonas rarisocia TaxID=2528026 RepID=A0A517Z2J6_9PLAN|nr:translation initiation factor IF-2 [Maioricimonas rarisocia]QDU36669.1 Translation initiation factor IF-2 [Maioricimonas rarisocia]
MKIRIFALAKELGLDSKELIQRCNEAGLNVKSSPLASISPEERDMVLELIRKKEEGGGGPEPGPSAPPTPSRDPAAPERMGKVRQIRNLGPLAGSMRSRRGGRDEDESPDAEVEAAQEALAAETGQPQPVAEAEATPAPEEAAVTTEVATEEAPAEAEGGEVPEVAAEAEEETQVVQTVEAAAEAETGIEEPPEAAAETEAAEAVESEEIAAEDRLAEDEAPPESEEGEGGETRKSGISRDEYVAPGGTGLSGIREMKPRGSIRGVGGKARKAKEKDKDKEKEKEREKKKAPQLPSLATPNFKPPAAPERKEGPAQKPDLPLTADILKQKSPLASILKKHKDDTKKGRRDRDEEESTPRRGKPAAAAGLGLSEAREERRRKRQRSRVDEEERPGGRSIARAPKRQRRSSGPKELKSSATVTLPISIRELSEELGRPARDLLGILFRAGQMVKITDLLDDEETVLELGLEMGVEIEVEREEDLEDRLTERFEKGSEDFGVPLESRAPIITVLGHVDHGKTTLVDRLRSTNVVASEAGGITQHIAAYQVEHDGKKLTFVDTPGHAAFGEMRARGANVTDIVVLVVAADDSVMPQTLECISHAKAAGVPIVVAMNKVDLPDINEQKVLTDLSQHNVLPSEWGGDTEVVRISALKGTGIDDLLETLLLTAELHEYTAPVEIPGEGVCLEAFRDEGLGPLAWFVVRRGQLRIGDIIVCGNAYGRVRAMYNDRDEEIQVAGPSDPIKVAGLVEVPGAGDHFFVMSDLDDARQIAEERQVRGRTELLARRGGPKRLEDFFADGDGSSRDLPLILKADTPGSIEALRSELQKFEHEEVRIDIIHEGVGGVNESDVTLAASAGAIIIAFHVIPEDRAVSLAHQEGVDIRRYNIIYNVTDEIKQALEGLLRPEEVEVATGRAIVLRTFSISRTGTIAGCRILSGTIERNNRVHVIREQRILNDYPIASLRREKDDVREVREGMECGIRLDGFNDVKEGDLLEAFRVEERKRTLED